MEQKYHKIIITLLSGLLILTTLNIYQDRRAQVRICMAISAVHDAVATRLDNSVYDKATVGIFNHCVGNLFWGIPGLSAEFVFPE